ncbi:hypothetical protein [Nostoc sp. PCC 9305]
MSAHPAEWTRWQIIVLAMPLQLTLQLSLTPIYTLRKFRSTWEFTTV